MATATVSVLLRMPPDLYLQVKNAATAEGVTATKWIVGKLHASIPRSPETHPVGDAPAALAPAKPLADEDDHLEELGPNQLVQGDLAKELGVVTTSLSNAKLKGFRGWRFTGKYCRRPNGGRSQPVWEKV